MDWNREQSITVILLLFYFLTTKVDVVDIHVKKYSRKKYIKNSLKMCFNQILSTYYVYSIHVKTTTAIQGSKNEQK